ncbi:uncharacterized protein LOC116616003 [Nematostella vectensis]|uniref:uncharacterized protein LOC116616003 n=1 Tax=Nematostella vectensis TaxID=45351 RepID=UPI0020778E9F|nr:uncharacterized protein LOC116616003 [Nematostella vectensis]
MEPSEVKVVVYAARNLQPKKPGRDVCNASVVFGVGKDKFRTDQIRDNNPTWNEESSIKVSKSAPLLFTVNDHEEILGNVTVPLAQIPTGAHRRRWMPLTSTKGGPVSGDLCFDCWVLSYRQAAPSSKWSKWFPSSRIKEKDKRRKSIAMASVSLKGSHSIENLSTRAQPETVPDPLPIDSIRVSAIRRVSSASTLPSWNRPPPSGAPPPPPIGAPPPPPPDDDVSMTPVKDAKLKFGFSFKPRLTPTLGQIMSGSGHPEITVLTPKSGPASGGTKITIRGINLGNSRDDVLSLSVNGSDCRRSLQWHSSAKVTCVTKPWGGSGPVVIVTKSGGRASSSTKFTFEEEKKEKSDDSKVSKQALMEELTRLRYEVQCLADENKAMKQYIDNVMLLLMEKYPRILEELCNS